MAGLVFYLSDDTTLATALALSTTDGVASSTVILHLWNDKGGLSSAYVDNVRLGVRIEDPGNPGSYLDSGLDALDGHHFQARVVGASLGNSAMPILPSGDWFPLGAGSLLELSRIYGNSARYVEVRYYPPLAEGAASETLTVRFFVVANDTQYGIPAGLMESVGQGILPGVTDGRLTEWIRVPTVTASGTPDAIVHVAGPDEWLWRGIPDGYHDDDDPITLNQTDGAAAALTTGTSYIALLSRPLAGGAAVGTKGVKAASPVAPAVPADHLPFKRVTVGYHASGFSVISSGAITSIAYSGRFALVSSASSLTVTIGPGRALVGGALVVFGSHRSFALPASSTSRVWISPSGALALVTTSDDPPFAGAEWLYSIVTDGTGVTSSTDKRRYLAPASIPIVLYVSGNETVAAGQARAMIPFRWCLDRITASVLTAAAGGATGSTVLDINKVSGGTSATIFTNQGGTYETRPKIAAGSYTDVDTCAEVRTGEAGDWLVLDVDTITSGGTRAADIAVTLWVYPR